MPICPNCEEDEDIVYLENSFRCNRCGYEWPETYDDWMVK
jgi:tRNA(Ile2) C34 agmatinyltransferase TiaS